MKILVRAVGPALQDIAILTGGQAISEDLGIKLENRMNEPMARTWVRPQGQRPH